jgi:hypothetical protein
LSGAKLVHNIHLFFSIEPVEIAKEAYSELSRVQRENMTALRIPQTPEKKVNQ